MISIQRHFLFDFLENGKSRFSLSAFFLENCINCIKEKEIEFFFYSLKLTFIFFVGTIMISDVIFYFNLFYDFPFLAGKFEFHSI
jgi:hypothetical protein